MGRPTNDEHTSFYAGLAHSQITYCQYRNYLRHFVSVLMNCTQALLKLRVIELMSTKHPHFCPTHFRTLLLSKKYYQPIGMSTIWTGFSTKIASQGKAQHIASIINLYVGLARVDSYRLITLTTMA